MADFQLVNENGTMLARDPATGDTIPLSMGDVDAQSLSTGEVFTVEETTLQAIEDAITNYEVVILRQGATYTGSDPINIDSSADADVTVLAHGATIDHSSGPDIAVDIDSGGDINTDFSFAWKGGRFVGPGKAAGTRNIRVTNTYGVTLEPDQIRNAEYLVEVRNFNHGGSGDNYCERTRIRHIGQMGGCTSCIKFTTPEPHDGGSDTSFRRTELIDLWAWGFDEWVVDSDPDTGIYDSRINLVGGFGDDTEIGGIHVQGSWMGSVIEGVNVESDIPQITVENLDTHSGQKRPPELRAILGDVEVSTPDGESVPALRVDDNMDLMFGSGKDIYTRYNNVSDFLEFGFYGGDRVATVRSSNFGLDKPLHAAGGIKLFDGDHDLNSRPLRNLRELDNGSGSDLANGEVAIDVNRGGAGTTALVWKAQDGSTTGYLDFTAGY